MSTALSVSFWLHLLIGVVLARLDDAALWFHSDRGVQYASNEFTTLLKQYPNVRQRTSRKGNCWDNAVAESFFKSLKTECTNRNKYQPFNSAESSVFQYIEAFYNTKRRHSALGYLTPAQFENN
jgi:putative transposase